MTLRLRVELAGYETGDVFPAGAEVFLQDRGQVDIVENIWLARVLDERGVEHVIQVRLSDLVADEETEA